MSNRKTVNTPPATSSCKMREPNPFDGSPNSNLLLFLAQVQHVIRNQPSEFPDDSKKVNYAISYLDGSAFTWATSPLDRGEEPAWASDFTLFQAELKRVFG